MTTCAHRLDRAERPEDSGAEFGRLVENDSLCIAYDHSVLGHNKELEKRRLRRQKPCLHAAHCSVSVLSRHGGSFTFCVYLCFLDDEHTIDLRFLAMC